MNRYGENHMVFPQSESLARLMISMTLEQLRSCCALKKKRYGIQIKEMRQETKCSAGSPIRS
nr:hypothetical protein [Sedimentibacter sp.]